MTLEGSNATVTPILHGCAFWQEAHNLLRISVLTEAEGWDKLYNEISMCRTIDNLSILIGQFVTGLLSKWQVKEVWKRRITSKSSCSYKNVQVTLQLQIPSSRNRDAFCSKVWYHDAVNGAGTAIQQWITRHIGFLISKNYTSRFNCIDWWVQVSACSDFSGSYQGLLTSLIIAAGRPFEPVCSWIFVGMQGFEPWFSESKSGVVAITLHPNFHI